MYNGLYILRPPFGQKKMCLKIEDGLKYGMIFLIAGSAIVLKIVKILNFFSRLLCTKKIKPKRHKTASKGNPLKQLADRTDIKQEYEEIKTDLAEKELRRVKREQSKSVEKEIL